MSSADVEREASDLDESPHTHDGGGGRPIAGEGRQAPAWLRGPKARTRGLYLVLALAVIAGGAVLFKLETSGAPGSAHTGNYKPALATSTESAAADRPAQPAGDKSSLVARLQATCILRASGQRLCGWPATAYCNRVLGHLGARGSLTCSRAIRRLNQERTRQYELSQEASEEHGARR